MNPALPDGSCAECHIHSGVIARLNTVEKDNDDTNGRVDVTIRNGLIVIGLCLSMVVAMFGWTAYEIRSLDRSVDDVREVVAGHVAADTARR